MLRFKGPKYLRQRIVCATLASKPIVIEGIRPLDENPGLTDYEASFLRLMDKITNGTTIEINETGTVLKYRPGVIVGGRRLEHNCGVSRGIGYFLEGLVCLLPFGKKQSSITLTGITNNESDLSVDLFRTVTLRLMRFFMPDAEELSIKILKRGAPPLGGGEILFVCPVVRQLQSVQLDEPGHLTKIRGISYTTKVAPAMANRMGEAAKELLGEVCEDVYTYNDHYRKAEGGRSPGYALSLVAESSKGGLLSVEACATTESLVAEEVGLLAARMLCEEMHRGGFVDTNQQWLVLLFMALTPEDVSKVLLGKMSKYTISLLRNIRKFFDVVFKIKASGDQVLLTCLGCGFKNLSKYVT